MTFTFLPVNMSGTDQWWGVESSYTTFCLLQKSPSKHINTDIWKQGVGFESQFSSFYYFLYSHFLSHSSYLCLHLSFSVCLSFLFFLSFSGYGLSFRFLPCPFFLSSKPPPPLSLFLQCVEFYPFLISSPALPSLSHSLSFYFFSSSSSIPFPFQSMFLFLTPPPFFIFF